jgi:hypothetical protein
VTVAPLTDPTILGLRAVRVGMRKYSNLVSSTEKSTPLLLTLNAARRAMALLGKVHTIDVDETH